VFHGDALDAQARYAIRADGCTYLFAYPRIHGLNYVEFDDGAGHTERTNKGFPLQILLEPDFRLYLQAATKPPRPDPTPALGFPMNPLSKTCR
jgi:hypothetical protein